MNEHPQPSNLAQIISEISRAIASAPLDSEELAEVAYLEASRLFETDFFQIGVFDSDIYRTLIWIRDGERLPDLTFEMKSGQEGLVGWIRENRTSILVHDFEGEAETLPAQPSYASDDPPASGMFAPLCSSDEVLGVIAIQSRKPNAFNQDDLVHLEILAGMLAPALRSSIIQTKLENLFAQKVVTQEITKQLTSLDPIADRVERTISLICQAFGYQSVNLYEYQDGQLFLSASSTIDMEYIPDDFEIPGIVQLVSEQRTSLISDSETEISGAPKLEIQMGIPLSVVDRLVGVLHIECHPDQSLPADQQAALQAVGYQTAFAILEASNYEQHQEEAWITTVLLEAAKHAAEPGDPKQALEAVLQLAILLGGVNWAMLFLTHEGSGILTIGPAAGLKRIELIELGELRMEPSSFGIEFPIPEGDEPKCIHLPAPIHDILDEQQCLSFALSDGVSLLGLMLVEDQPLTDRRISLLAGIAHQISLRIENTNLLEDAAQRRSLERELETAREIQTSFLPQSSPHHPQWDIGVTWRQAREVSGDFYDFIALPGDGESECWGIVIADVSDKGIPAALYMALCRTLMRSVAYANAEPGTTLEQVNRSLIQDTHADLFVSMFYGIWYPQRGEVIYANAGHQPPLLITPHTPSRILSTHGIVLGVQDGARYPQEKIRLAPGQMLVLYTDGVTEAFNSSDEMFGLHRLENLILGAGNLSAQSIADRIKERVIDHCGSLELPDDLTALIIQCRSPDSSVY